MTLPIILIIQIIYIHNIDITLQLVYAHKDAYASELLRARERETTPATFNSALRHGQGEDLL